MVVLVDSAAVRIVRRAHRNREGGRVRNSGVAGCLRVGGGYGTGKGEGDDESADREVLHGLGLLGFLDWVGNKISLDFQLRKA